MNNTCSHLDQIKEFDTPTEATCQECVSSGDDWVHLTQCLSCGYVGCCEDSKNKHAHHHFRGTHHPIVKSLESGDDWMWCYVDEIFIGRKAAA